MSQSAQPIEAAERLHPHVMASPASDAVVSLNEMEQAADRHAHCLWGERVARGEPVPVSDAQSVVTGFMFPYVVGLREFPTFTTLFALVRETREGQGGDRNVVDYRALLGRCARVLGPVEFGSVVVSARRDGYPIQQVTHYLHPYFLFGEAAFRAAEGRFGDRAISLRRLRGADPCELLFEFEHGDEQVLVNARSLEVVDIAAATPEATAAAAPHSADEAEAAWQAVSDRRAEGIAPADAGASHSYTYLANKDLVPPLLWTLNCATTAKAMVLGYWDHYVAGIGTLLGFGRLIDYWMDHPSNGANVPNLLDEVHAPNNIDVWKVNGYTCVWNEVPANAGNDFAWAEYTNEIDSGRPAAWSFPGHTMAGLGYHIETWGKWAVVWDTWGVAKPSEWSFDQCSQVAQIIPTGGSNADHLAILAPHGGEILEQSVPADVAWLVWGGKIDRTEVQFSSDGGQNWSTVAKDLHAGVDTGHYRWLTGPATAKGRVCVRGTAAGTYVAGDGSYQDFVVQGPSVGGQWTKIFDAAGTMLAGFDVVTGAAVLYATEAASGDIYLFGGKAGVAENWFRIGGPGSQFVLDARGRLYGLSPDGSGVWRYTGTAMKWEQIGGPAHAIYGDVDGVCATDPDNGDLYRFLGPAFNWKKIGGPGKAFAIDGAGMVYGIAPDESGVWRYDGLFGALVPWVQVGGPASNIIARGLGVYATNPQSGDIHFFHGDPQLWTHVGGAGSAFCLDTRGRLYGLSPDASSVWRYDGSHSAAREWTQIGGPAAAIAAGLGIVLALEPGTSNLMLYQ